MFCENRSLAVNVRLYNLDQTLYNVTRNMPRHWLFLPIDPGKVKCVTFAMLFERRTAAMVFDTYIAASRGDASGLALMSLACDFVLPSLGTWGEFFAVGVSADYDPSRDYATELNPPNSILGSPLALLIWGHVKDHWPIELIPAELRQVQPSDVETLLVSGSIDFSTPAEFAARELLPALRNGQQVILAEMGHVGDVFNIQPDATERLLTSFYSTGIADGSLYTYAPMTFHVSWGFPVLAKTVLSAGLLGAVGSVVFFWYLVRWFKRRRAT